MTALPIENLISGIIMVAGIVADAIHDLKKHWKR